MGSTLRDEEKQVIRDKRKAKLKNIKRKLVELQRQIGELS